MKNRVCKSLLKRTALLLAAVITVLLLLALASCSKDTENTDVPDGMVNIASDDSYYSFYVPTTWKYTEGQNTPSAYYANNDASNVSLMSFSVEHSDYTVGDWWESFVADFESVYEGFEIISDEETVLDGVAAVKKVFKGTLSGTEYQFMQVAAMKKESLSAPQVVVFTYTSVPSTFDSHNDDVAKMLENFKFN